MRTLTGQIEQLGYQLKQLQDQLARMQADNEFRLSALEGGKPAPRPPAAAPSGQSSSAAPVTPPRPPAMPSASAAPAPAPAAPQIAATPPVQPISAPPGGAGVQLGAPPQPLGQLTLDGPPAEGGQPLDLSSLARGASQTASLGPNGAPPAPVMTGDARTDYEQAYQHILAGDYDGAESSFRSFLAAYPSDANAADAQYWLGESLFARGKYRESADAFLSGYKTYPKSAKGADTLLKLGLSLAGLGERDAACQTYAQVLKQYPQVSNALRQRVATEQASASC
jgi:tol-pal system protein YbgF